MIQGYTTLSRIFPVSPRNRRFSPENFPFQITTQQQEASKESAETTAVETSSAETAAAKTSVESTAVETSVETPPAVQAETPAAAEPEPPVSEVDESVEPTESMITESGVSTLEISSIVSEEVLVKKTKSCPVVLKDFLRDEDEEEGSSNESTLDALLTELSLDAIPLYKPEGVTDLTSQLDVGSLVVESEAKTNLLEEAKSSDELPGDAAQGTATAEETEGDIGVTSAETISLKESEGKTEIN